VQFLYPTSTQYPVDEVCGEIVHALEARNFVVPGISVEMDTYGSGEQRMRYVRSVTGSGFKLVFRRTQRSMPGRMWRDCAAVNDVCIPRKMLSVYEDESGPTLHLYVGKDWDADSERFWTGLHVNSKLRGEPRTYLRYSGACFCPGGWTNGRQHTHQGGRSPLLIADNDLRREYDPEGEEPKQFDTAQVMEEFRAYLRDVVLAEITRHPEAVVRIDPIAEPAPVPWPSAIGLLFCFGGDRDVDRIHDGQADPAGLDAADRYGMAGSGYRLNSWDIRNDGTVPKVAYDGFLWCGLGDVMKPDGTPNFALKIPGHWRGSERYVIRVMPMSADGIFIADHAPYEQRRKELSEMDAAHAARRGQSPPTTFTSEQVSDFNNARARTIVPIHEYKGGFAEPVVLINRELGFDEVEVMFTDRGTR
jgi:hypothetical protein